MTELCFFSSDALSLTTEVLSCSALPDGQFRVILAATLFHPQGGGQPSDQGHIGSATLLLAIREDQQIVHITDQAVALGPVTLTVNGAVRQLHSRYHSAGHLIAYAGEQSGWQAVKGNHRPGEGRIVFRAADNARPVSAEDISLRVAEIIAADLPLQTSEYQGRRRVSWGSLPATECGGTHVASTGATGEVVVSKVKLKKDELSVSYLLPE